MLRRVTTLAALAGGDVSSVESGSIRRRLGVTFTEINRRRHSRTSACTALSGLSWNFDPPATNRHDDKPASFDLTPTHWTP